LWNAAANAVKQAVPSERTPTMTAVDRSSPIPNGPPVAAAGNKTLPTLSHLKRQLGHWQQRATYY